MTNKFKENPDLACISVLAAGKILGVSHGTAYQMARSGQLPVIRCGQRRLVVPLAALRKMLEGKNDGSRHQQD